MGGESVYQRFYQRLIEPFLKALLGNGDNIAVQNTDFEEELVTDSMAGSPRPLVELVRSPFPCTRWGRSFTSC